MSSAICDIHHLNFESFCKDCQKAFCSSCSRLGHEKHQILETEDLILHLQVISL